MKLNRTNLRTFLMAVTGLAGLAIAGPAQAVDPAWKGKVGQLIKANYSYPRSAQLRGEQGEAKIRIAFSGTGKVLSVDLVKSTGSAILDREAVRIPMKVNSFPSPPGGTNAEIVFPISWRLVDK